MVTMKTTEKNKTTTSTTANRTSLWKATTATANNKKTSLNMLLLTCKVVFGFNPGHFQS